MFRVVILMVLRPWTLNQKLWFFLRLLLRSLQRITTGLIKTFGTIGNKFKS